MKVGSTVGSSAGNTKAGLPLLTMFFFCCMFLSSILYAQDIPESEVPATEIPQAEAPPADKAVEEIKTEPAPVEVVPTDEELKLADTLKKNNKCLRCHNKDKIKLLEDGEEMSIQVHKEDYLSSAHAEVKCISCHQAIGDRKHPSKKTNITISNQRDYSVEMNDSCGKCHQEKSTQYKGSVHSAMVAQGNAQAPVCSDCHSAHAVESMADYQPEKGFPCKNCHENIFNAYSASVHGQARINGNTIRDSHIQSPICADCHKSHEITALAIGDVLRTTCIACHENVTLLHSQWLPNAGTHLDIVSCAVCHAPFARRKYDLHLYDNVEQVPVTQKEGDQPLGEQLQAIAEKGADDPLEIWKAKGGFDQQGGPVDISLRSRMEVMSGVAAHQIANKSFAVRACESCHESDSRQNQNITVSITQADGRKQSFETDREVLSSVSAVNSISDFYALGGAPNKFLDYLVLLSLLAGFMVPIGHFTMGKMIKEKTDKGEQ
jgi:hypothetical protein